MLIAACRTTKKNTTSTISSIPAPTPTTTSAPPFPLGQPENGIYTPGNDELIAIQTQYKDVTLEKLKEGHEIYIQGACTNCHTAKNIYQFEITQWKDIIEDMAQRAYLSDAQKDAVYKYVLAMKARQSK